VEPAFTRLQPGILEAECERSLATHESGTQHKERGIYDIGVIGTEILVHDCQKVKDTGYPVKWQIRKGQTHSESSRENWAIPVSVEEVVQDVDILFLSSSKGVSSAA